MQTQYNFIWESQKQDIDPQNFESLRPKRVENRWNTIYGIRTKTNRIYC